MKYFGGKCIDKGDIKVWYKIHLLDKVPLNELVIETSFSPTSYYIWDKDMYSSPRDLSVEQFIRIKKLKYE